METNEYERFKILVSYLKKSHGILTDKNLAADLDVGPSYLSEIMNRKRKITSKFAKKIELIFEEVNSSWLLSGFGEMLHRRDESDIPDSDLTSIVKVQQDTIRSQQDTIRTLSHIIESLSPGAVKGKISKAD